MVLPRLGEHRSEMENDDWKRLGDVVRGITERLEVTSGPPVPTADAMIFVKMLREVYGPLPQEAARRTEGQAECEAKGRAELPHSGDRS